MHPRPAYDRIGVGYARYRRPDPEIARRIDEALGSARTVLSVGAGAGSYEPADRSVVAVEPSPVMIEQRQQGAGPAVQAVAELLPLRTSSSDAALAVLTIHHWSDPWAGLAEMRRVARRQVVLTFDPDLHCTHWLTDYFPEIVPIFHAAPPVDAVADALGGADLLPIPLRHDTPDGMTIAYWRRPNAYLDPAARAGSSALQQIDERALERGLEVLERDLASGEWQRRYGDLLEQEYMDYGLRLVVSSDG